MAATQEQLERSVEALLADDMSLGTHDMPSGGTSATTTLPASGPDPRVALASAMLEAQGPRPTFADFASVPSVNPFGGAADTSGDWMMSDADIEATLRASALNGRCVAEGECLALWCKVLRHSLTAPPPSFDRLMRSLCIEHGLSPLRFCDDLRAAEAEGAAARAVVEEGVRDALAACGVDDGATREMLLRALSVAVASQLQLWPAEG